MVVSQLQKRSISLQENLSFTNKENQTEERFLKQAETLSKSLSLFVQAEFLSQPDLQSKKTESVAEPVSLQSQVLVEEEEKRVPLLEGKALVPVGERVAEPLSLQSEVLVEEEEKRVPFFEGKALVPGK